MLSWNLPPFYLFLCVRLSQKLTRKGWSPGSSRSWNCSACSLGKLCWTCLCTDRKGEDSASPLLPLISLFSRGDVTPAECYIPPALFPTVTFTLILSPLPSLFSLSLSFTLSSSFKSTSIISCEAASTVKHTVLLTLSDICSFFVCLFSFYSSWTYGSNSLPTAGSVSGGVARRGQRQFQMTPRGLPAGRMGLLSPSGIGGASPRHTLTSPALAGQGRQVSIPVIGWAFERQFVPCSLAEIGQYGFLWVKEER